MTSFYIPVTSISGNLYLRIDVTDKEHIILLVEKGKTVQEDRIVKTFDSLEPEWVLDKKRIGDFAKNLSKEFKGKIPEVKIKAVVHGIASELSQILQITQPARQISNIPSAPIYLITGAPRLQKTSTAFIMAAVAGFKTLLYITRTINTFEKTIETIAMHIPKLEGIPITAIISNVEACPVAKKLHDTSGHTAAMMHCDTCPYQAHKPQNVDTPLHLTPSILREIYDTKKICPSRFIRERIEYFNNSNTQQIIILSYARLKHELPKFINLDNIQVIFDEARHITDICILHQGPLNNKPTKKSHNEIREDYVNAIRAIDFSMLSSNSLSKVEMERDSFCDSILNKNIFTGHFNVKEPLEELLNSLHAPLNITGTTQLNPTYTDLESQIGFLNLLKAANGNNIALDFIKNIDSENSVNLIIRKMEDKNSNIESRANFTKLVNSAKMIYLVDSTPYPERYYGFWLGGNYNIKEISLPIKYNFNIVIENVKRSLKATYKDKGNTKRFTDIIKGVEGGSKVEIFSSSKNESHTLKKYGIDCKHARGTEVEGVQSDKDYTLITRLPLQNIYSEKYRGTSIRAMTGNRGSHSEYIKIKAYAELLQESFRTAKIGKTSGSFWMSLDDSHIPIIKNYWPWLNKGINFLVLKKNLRVADKADYVVQGLTNGILKFKRSDRVISKKIIDFFNKNPNAKKEDCVNALPHRKDTIRRLIRHLLATGQIKLK